MPFEIWENFTVDGIFNYAIKGYSETGIWFWPLILFGVVGYVYAIMNSIAVAVAGIIITLASFAVTTNVLAGVPEVTQIFYIVTIIGIAMLLTTLLIKVRRH